MFSRHGAASTQALPPLIPIAFLDAPRVDGSLLREMNRAIAPGWRMRLVGPAWIGGHLYALRRLRGSLGRAAAVRNCPVRAEAEGPFPAAEGFYLGCGEVPGRDAGADRSAGSRIVVRICYNRAHEDLRIRRPRVVARAQLGNFRGTTAQGEKAAVKSFPAFGILLRSPGTLAQLRTLLEENSGLPGPRANLELAYAFASAVARMRLEEWQWEFLLQTAATSPTKAPENTPKVYVTVCALLRPGFALRHRVSRVPAAAGRLPRSRRRPLTPAGGCAKPRRWPSS